MNRIFVGDFCILHYVFYLSRGEGWNRTISWAFCKPTPLWSVSRTLPRATITLHSPCLTLVFYTPIIGLSREKNEKK